VTPLGSEPGDGDALGLSIRFVLRRDNWLRYCWPAIGLWGFLTGFGLLFVVMGTFASWFALFGLAPVWWFSGRRFVALIRFLVKGEEQVHLCIGTNGGLGAVSADERLYTPIDMATLHDESNDHWLLVARGGGIQIPIPKSALSSEALIALQREVARQAARHAS
jgi:hypothetical protein